MRKETAPTMARGVQPMIELSGLRTQPELAVACVVSTRKLQK